MSEREKNRNAMDRHWTYIVSMSAKWSATWCIVYEVNLIFFPIAKSYIGQTGNIIEIKIICMKRALPKSGKIWSS